MISVLSLALFSLQATSAPPLVTISTPNVRVSQALERAKRDLPLFPADPAGISTFARTSIGYLDPLAEARWSLLSLHSFWNTQGDTALLRERWPQLRAEFISAAGDTTHDAGVWLATLDAAIAIASVLKDAATDSLARSLYAGAEARLAQAVSLYGLAFGFYQDEQADTLLTNMLPYVRAVWPIGNGLAALGFYEYHRDSTAFAVLDTMAQRDSFAAPMFVLPLMRGLIGWETDATNRAAAFEPHLPAAWSWFNVSNLPIGTDRLDATIRRDHSSYSIYLQRQVPGRHLSLRIAPALPTGARVRTVTVNERDVPVQVESSAHDVHVVIEIALQREAQIDIEFEMPRKRPSPR